MANRSRPAHAAEPRKRRLPKIDPHRVVIAQWHPCLEIGHAADRGEAVVAAKARTGRTAYKPAQRALLRRDRVQPRKLIPPSCRAPYNQGRDVQHQGFSIVTTGNSRATLSGRSGILTY